MEPEKTFGPRLRYLRNERGMSLAELSADTGIAKTTLGRWETTRAYPNVPGLLKLAKALRVSVEYLVCGSEK